MPISSSCFNASSYCFNVVKDNAKIVWHGTRQNSGEIAPTWERVGRAVLAIFPGIIVLAVGSLACLIGKITEKKTTPVAQDEKLQMDQEIDSDDDNSLPNQIPAEFSSNEEFMTPIIENDGLAIQFADETLKNKQNLALLAVNQNGCALQYLPNFQKDRKVVLAALRNTIEAFQFIDPSLRKEQILINLVERETKKQGKVGLLSALAGQRI